MVTINVNGVQHEVQAPTDTPLLYVLRNDLELSGPQFGCGDGRCGSALREGHSGRWNLGAKQHSNGFHPGREPTVTRRSQAFRFRSGIPQKPRLGTTPQSRIFRVLGQG